MKCPDCNGEGRKWEYDEDFQEEIHVDCDTCKMKGEIDDLDYTLQEAKETVKGLEA